MSTWTHHRARHAGLRRTRPADDPDVVDAKRDLAAARLEEHVRRIVAAAPPLTPAQRDRIAGILRPTAAGAR